ncbi:DNRLRE domain-containing protein [Cohnella cellulosilytica]|uniref:DNRLRE domain-containing protein n=1 Tax=Cohnella cellulosilytica TaxID=986710 RepID=A0ABW2FDP8_9BACL
MKSTSYSRNRLLTGAMSLLLLWSVLLAAFPYAASAAPGSSARLSALSLSEGTLSPGFEPGRTTYAASVTDSVYGLAVTPVAEDADAAIAVSINGENAVPVVSGSASPELPLEIGNNVIAVRVISGGGETKSAYTIRITKTAVVLQQGAGYSGQKDVHVSEGTHRDKNTGAHEAVEVGYFDPLAADRKFGLFQFDLSSIPSDAVLTEARLELNLVGTRARSAGRYDKVLHLHELTGAWDEGTGTGFDGTVGAPGVIWNTRPGFDEAIALDSKLVGTTLNQWYAWDLTGLAQRWVSGTTANYGVILKETDSASDEETVPSTKDFASAQHADSAIRPKLALNYKLPLTGIRLDSEPLSLTVGQLPVSLADAVFVRPLNAELTGAPVWSSADETVATVSAAGVVTPVGEGTTEIRIDAFGGSGSFTASVPVTVAALDTEGTLADLSVKGAELAPAFLPGVHEYELQVPLNARQVSVTPTAFAADSVITIADETGDEQTVVSGSPGLPVRLQQGTTRIRITVRPAGASGPEAAGQYVITVKHRETGGAGDDIIREFLDPNGRTLVVAHRGNWLNGMPENGLNSIRESIDEGVDMVELDIRTTSDGVPVLMHDDSVNRTTNGSGNVSSLTLAQIKSLCLKNSDGSISNPCETIPTLEEAMALARGHIMVNLDIKNADWDTMWDILIRTDTTDHALYKTSAGKASTASWMAQFKDSAVQPLFMQLASDPAVVHDFLNPETTPFTVHAFEISFNDDNAPIVDPALIREMHDRGARVWVNTIFSVPGLVGRHGDYAFLSDPTAGFPWLLDRGIDMIQTDTTELLLQYLKERGNGPSTGVTQTVMLQQGLNGYAGAADTHIVELPENNGNTSNFGKNAQIKVGPQQPVLPVIDGNLHAKVAAISVVGSSPENEGKDNLNDFSLSSKWLTMQNQSVVTFEMTEPVVVRGYALSSANDTPGRDPQDWTLEGSLNGTDWTELDRKTEQTFTERFQTKVYRNFTNDTAYSRYRLNITANRGESLLQLAEIQLSDGSAARPALPVSQDHRYGLLKFDLSSLPAEAKVTSAKLGLYLVEAGPSGESPVQTIAAHAIAEEWTEGGGTGNNGSPVPDGQRWTTWANQPGYRSAPSATAVVDKQLYGWKELEIGALVKGWQDNPASNFGLLLDSGDMAMSFASSDNAVSGWRPKLEVTYTIPVSGIALTPSELSLEAGEQFRLTAVIVPDNGLNRSVTWQSSDETVARVDRTGLVTAVGQGTAVITAKTADGQHTASAEVIVTRSQATAFLRDVQLSAGGLTEAFFPETAAYAANVPEVYNHLAVTPYAEDDEAAIAVAINGGPAIPVANGQPSEPLPLEIGDNVIVITVTANNGARVKTYQITVPKAAVAYQEGVDGYTGTADTQLSEGTGGSGTKYYQYNLGAQHGFEVGYYNQNVSDRKYGMVRFDQLPLPEGAIVSEASLNLHHYAQRSANRARDLFVHKANAPWAEGRGGSGDSNDGSPAEPGETTWENYITNGTNPFAPEPVAQVRIDAYPQWYAFDIPDIVQSWVDAPEINYGVVLKPLTYPDASDSTMTGTKKFHTKDYTDPSLRPYLRIVYALPASGIALDRSELDLPLGGGTQLAATVKPLNAIDKTVVWSSDNELVARVDATGYVTAIGPGTAAITAVNANGDAAHAAVTVRNPGTSAELTGLTLSSGVVSPALTAGRYGYDAIVPAGASGIRVTPVAADAHAAIAVRVDDGEPQTVKSGEPSRPLVLGNGSSLVLSVTSEDGSASRTYTLSVVTASGLSDIRLSAGTLSPAFAPQRLQYEVNVPGGTSDIVVTPYALEAGKTIRIRTPEGADQTVASGRAGTPISLRPGTNIIWLETGTAGTADNRTYTIAVNRQQASGGSGGGGGGGGPIGGAPSAAETVKLGDELTVAIPQEEAGIRLTLRKLERVANPAPFERLSDVYVIDMERAHKLSKPLTLSFAFEAGKAGNGRASVFRWDEAGRRWLEIGGYAENGVITAVTNEIGTFAVYLVAGETSADPQPAGPTGPTAWPDVRNHWAASAISRAAERGILTGYPDGSMKPDTAITRAQFSAMLVRALALDGSLDLSGFKDRSAIPQWAEASLAAASSAGILSGYADGTLRPNQLINRAEMVTMLMRAYPAETNASQPELPGFKDEAAIPAWSKASVAKALQLGLVVGSQGEFKPAGAATRAEAVTVILRLLDIQP